MGRDGHPSLHTHLVGPSTPDGLSCLIFCARLLRRARTHNFESKLEEIAWAYPNTRILPSFTLVWTGSNGRIDGFLSLEAPQLELDTVLGGLDSSFMSIPDGLRVS